MDVSKATQKPKLINYNRLKRTFIHSLHTRWSFITLFFFLFLWRMYCLLFLIEQLILGFLSFTLSARKSVSHICVLLMACSFSQRVILLLLLVIKRCWKNSIYILNRLKLNVGKTELYCTGIKKWWSTDHQGTYWISFWCNFQ